MNSAYYYFWKIFDKTCPVCDVRRPSTELWIQVSKPNIFPTLSLHRLPLEQPQNRLLTQTHHIKQQVCHIVELLNNQVSNQKILSLFNRQYISQINEIMLCIFIDDAVYCICWSAGFDFYITLFVFTLIRSIKWRILVKVDIHIYLYNSPFFWENSNFNNNQIVI